MQEIGHTYNASVLTLFTSRVLLLDTVGFITLNFIPLTKENS